VDVDEDTSCASCLPSRRTRRSAAAQEVTLEMASDGQDDDEKSDAAAATKMAACAICVGVGYLCDPPEVQGLAHFVEHMLFMGTAEHPKENGWSEFLASHGGEDNGETSAEHTACFFDVHPSYLRAAVARFAGFFSGPLFKWSGSQREVQAIDSEFEQARQADECRADQVVYSLMAEGHPYRRFGWGNKRSLVELPAAAKVDVRAQLEARAWMLNLPTRSPHGHGVVC
jgi:secreted Zn-dependent insulinase-like peptidase